MLKLYALLSLLSLCLAHFAWGEEKLEVQIPVNGGTETTLTPQMFRCRESAHDQRWRVQFLVPPIKGIQDKLPYKIDWAWTSVGYVRPDYCATVLSQYLVKVTRMPHVKVYANGQYERGIRRSQVRIGEGCPWSPQCWGPWEAFERQNVLVNIQLADGTKSNFLHFSGRVLQ